MSAAPLQAALSATAETGAPAAVQAVQAVQAAAKPTTLQEARRLSAALANSKKHASNEDKSIIGSAMNALGAAWRGLLHGGRRTRDRRSPTRYRHNRRNTKKNGKNRK